MELKTKAKLQQTFIPSIAMQQAFLVLQMPQIELAEWLHTQIEQNPLLEYSSQEPPPEEEESLSFGALDHLDELFQKAVFPEYMQEEKKRDPSLYHTPSLFEHLIDQAKHTFKTPSEMKIAEEIIGNLDERGFLGTFPTDEKILKIIQSFDPPGIAARDLQNSFLNQLQIKGKENSLIYMLISEHFDCLLHNKFLELEKKFNIDPSLLYTYVQKELKSLNWNPASSFEASIPFPIVPDVTFLKIENEWHIEINDSYLPKVELLIHSVENFSSSDREFIKRHSAQGKWILNIVAKRAETLKAIASYLLKTQIPFFNGNLDNITPLHMEEVAKELSLHKSTIARVTAQKYIASPHGIFAMRYFFAPSLKTFSGRKISNQTVKQLLSRLILKENKSAPLSDEALTEVLNNQGIKCARRTVTKYRKALKLPPSVLRKQ